MIQKVATSSERLFLMEELGRRIDYTEGCLTKTASLNEEQKQSALAALSTIKQAYAEDVFQYALSIGEQVIAGNYIDKKAFETERSITKETFLSGELFSKEAGAEVLVAAPAAAAINTAGNLTVAGLNAAASLINGIGVTGLIAIPAVLGVTGAYAKSQIMAPTSSKLDDMRKQILSVETQNKADELRRLAEKDNKNPVEAQEGRTLRI